ncbi:putative pxa domain-containing protein [Erysiphe neolycopersici]|uniref:Putative pxa domain-containing protein n=1 Tax=Erysiphe neolycopersici TaxID=212602 RepID=A0A420I490_9PEZI|nr:putative pxa domain-containing protein [Erysiphe neolycopersici]
MSHLQSRPKLRSSIISHNSSRSTSIDSRSKTQSPVLDPSHHISTESITDRATFSFVRRTLCSQLGDKGRSTCATIDEILPPLTSSNDVDLQLYAFIAIVIREYIQTWYQKITSDQVFVEELVNIFAHCTRALEQRLRKVDLESLLFDEIPELLETHIHAFHVSHLPLHRPPLQHDPRHIYHLLWPIPPLSPVPNDQQDVASREKQAENESSYRQLLVQGVLALLLPTEDLENDCLRSLVTEILSESILGGCIGEKASEPWILWEGISKLAVVTKSQISRTKTQDPMDQSAPSASKSIYPESIKEWNFCLNINHFVQKVFWLFLQYSFFVITAIHYLITTYTASSSQTCRNKSPKKIFSEEARINDPEPLLAHQDSKKPLLDMKLWSCWAILLNLEVRMPWLKAMLSMLQWAALTGPGKIGQTDGIIDKILSYIIHTHILTPTTLPNLLRNARSALFPNNLPASLSKKPTEAECVAIRRRCAESILELIPTGVRKVYFGLEWEDMVREVEEEVLCIFEDKYCNKHLLYGMVELILVRLMPELSESGIEDLLAERLN